MIYPKDFESKIGFDVIRNSISEKCISTLGKREVSAMAFSIDFASISLEINKIAEMMKIISTGLPLPISNMHDVVPSLREIRAEGSYITADKLLRLLQMLVLLKEVSTFFSHQKDEETDKSAFPNLDEEFSQLNLFPLLIVQLDRVVNKFGEVKDSASPELREIRMQIKSATGSMQRAMQRVVNHAISQGIIDRDVAPAIRDGRLVLPVSAGNKRSISGIVHDESSTGKTVYIEPTEVVEASNRLRELEIEERREIITILRDVANEIRPHIEMIEESCGYLGRLDFIRAKALFANELGAQKPHIHKNPGIEWYHATHPELVYALKGTGRRVVPLNLTLDSRNKILVISGPNAGGKSITLKTTAVVQYMLQCGIMPTVYANSHMGIFKNLFIDIGDEQSIENDLSTYSSHLKNMKYFLNFSDSHTLFLADEMGSGTEPAIGGAIAQSILADLADKGAYGIVTTHYQNLKTFAEETDGFVNGAMLYDRQHLSPTFELSVGSAGSSFAIDIATKIGLPKNVIERAKDIVGSDYVNLDKYLSEVLRDRKYWANKRSSIKEKEAKLDNLLSNYTESAQDIKALRKEIISEAKREAKEILDGVNSKIERTILEIRKTSAEKEKTKLLRKELVEFKDNVLNDEVDESEKLNKLFTKHVKAKVEKNKSKELQNKSQRGERPKDVPLGVGDFVKLKDGNMDGAIISVEGKKAEVAFGSIRTFVNLDKLIRGKKPKCNSALTAQTSSVSDSTLEESRKRQLNFKNEIDVRGMRGDEAVQSVVYFIDDAVQFSASKVRILHGTGHGILKTLIRQQLKSIPGVKSFADEDVRFGGAGITVVELY